MLDSISVEAQPKAFTGANSSDKPETGERSENTLNAKELFKPVEDYSDKQKEFRRKTLPRIFYLSSSAFHLFNTLFVSFLPEAIKGKVDKTAVNFSKIGHSIIQLDLARESLKNNRALDFIAKIVEPLLLLLVDLEDIPLIKGWSGALNMFDFAQAGRVGNQQESFTDNLQENFQEQKRMLSEIMSTENGNLLFKSPKDEKGHTMALSAYMMLAGSALGTFFGLGKRNFANKWGSLMKNIGSLVSNYSMWIHPNKNLSKAGKIYSVDAVLDSIQRFLPKEKVRPLNHLVMAINNIASNFYTLSSRNLNEASSMLYA